jgi:hypothetical protein
LWISSSSIAWLASAAGMGNSWHLFEVDEP